MVNYTNDMPFSKLFYDFYRYMKIDKKLLCMISIINDNNFEEFIRNIDIKEFNDNDINILQGIVLNKLSLDVFVNDVPDDEEEYCWNIGKEIVKRCNKEIILRNNSDDNQFVRTNA